MKKKIYAFLVTLLLLVVPMNAYAAYPQEQWSYDSYYDEWYLINATGESGSRTELTEFLSPAHDFSVGDTIEKTVFVNHTDTSSGVDRAMRYVYSYDRTFVSDYPLFQQISGLPSYAKINRDVSGDIVRYMFTFDAADNGGAIKINHTYLQSFDGYFWENLNYSEVNSHSAAGVASPDGANYPFIPIWPHILTDGISICPCTGSSAIAEESYNAEKEKQFREIRSQSENFKWEDVDHNTPYTITYDDEVVWEGTYGEVMENPAIIDEMVEEMIAVKKISEE